MVLKYCEMQGKKSIVIGNINVCKTHGYKYLTKDIFENREFLILSKRKYTRKLDAFEIQYLDDELISTKNIKKQISKLKKLIRN